MNKIQIQDGPAFKHFYFKISNSNSQLDIKTTSLVKRKIKNCNFKISKESLIKGSEQKSLPLRSYESFLTISSRTEKKRDSLHSSYLTYKQNQKKSKNKSFLNYKPFFQMTTTLRPKQSRKDKKHPSTTFKQNKNSLVIPSRTIQTSIRMRKRNYICNQGDKSMENDPRRLKILSRELSLGSCSYGKNNLLQRGKWVCSRPWSPDMVEDTILNLSKQEEN